MGEAEEKCVGVSARITVAYIGIRHMAVAIAERDGAGRRLKKLDAATEVNDQVLLRPRQVGIGEGFAAADQTANDEKQ